MRAVNAVPKGGGAKIPRIESGVDGCRRAAYSVYEIVAFCRPWRFACAGPQAVAVVC